MDRIGSGAPKTLKKIFCYLDNGDLVRDDLRAASCVCKLWNKAISKSPQLNPNVFTVEVLNKYFQRSFYKTVF